jgi:phenylpropionate dioxygenase-like ring-hydroxylating dioxygenase large terminal subunit
MDTAIVERLKREIRYEFAREGPPEGFPQFPDIPAGRYRDPAFFELEMGHLWNATWLYVTRQEELPEPGSHGFWERVRSPMLLVRGDDRRIRAFHNRAPGGGYLVAPPDESHLVREVVFDSGGNNLRAQDEFPRYRFQGNVIRADGGATYDLTGQPLSGAAAPLEEVRCETWAGWVFINQDANGPTLLDWLQPLTEQMAMFQGETLRIIDRRWVIIPCNWKVTVEAFQEVYHFKHIHHKGGVSFLDQRGATMGVLSNGHSRMITPVSKRAAEMMGMEDQLDWRVDISRQPANPVFKEIPTVNGMTRCTSTAFSAFPNLVTPVSATGMPFLLAWPIDVRTTLFEWVTFCVDWGDGPSPVTTPEWQARLSGFDVIMEEDTRNMAPMQKSLESPGLQGMPVSYQERRIWNCAEQLDRMVGPERIPPALRVPQLLAPYVER